MIILHLFWFVWDFWISGWPWDLELCKEGYFFNSPFISVCISHYQSPVQPTSLSKLGDSTRNQHNSFQNEFFCKKMWKGEVCSSQILNAGVSWTSNESFSIDSDGARTLPCVCQDRVCCSFDLGHALDVHEKFFARWAVLLSIRTSKVSSGILSIFSFACWHFGLSLKIKSSESCLYLFLSFLSFLFHSFFPFLFFTNAHSEISVGCCFMHSWRIICKQMVTIPVCSSLKVTICIWLLSEVGEMSCRSTAEGRSWPSGSVSVTQLPLEYLSHFCKEQILSKHWLLFSSLLQ